MNERTTQRRAAGAGKPAAFTLVELLVVIGIIVVLIGILLPVLGKVQDRARAADTAALIQSLGAQIDAYYADFNAYPGPLAYGEVNQAAGGGAAAKPDITVFAGSEGFGTYDSGHITMAENLVLGLLGGLRRMSPTSIQYNTEWVGTGPGMLGPTPKKLPTYGDAVNLSITNGPSGKVYGDYIDGNGVSGRDTIIPEYTDRFPDALPLLYLRARSGKRTGMNLATDNPVVTKGGMTRSGQYDYSQIEAYVYGNAADSIGVGRSLSENEYVPPPPPDTRGTVAGHGSHGLQTVDPLQTTDTLSGANRYPYDLYAALRHPTIPNTPKQENRYILISAGPDRVYGTRDDVTNFGAY